MSQPIQYVTNLIDCEHVKREQEESKENYLWLDKSDERKYMTDREILDKHINLNKSCLTRKEKEEVRDLLCEYRDAFSLRDEIGMCPNIEVKIDVTDKTPFFIRQFHAKEEEKAILDKENEKIMLLRNLKEGFSA